MIKLLNVIAGTLPWIAALILAVALLVWIYRQNPPLYDKCLAIIALALFTTFCGIISFWVMEWDLKLVLLIAVGMAGYDFWRDTFKRRPDTGPAAPQTTPTDPSSQKDGI